MAGSQRGPLFTQGRKQCSRSELSSALWWSVCQAGLSQALLEAETLVELLEELVLQVAKVIYLKQVFPHQIVNL